MITASFPSPFKSATIGVPVGTVRADHSKGVYELSWTVAPAARGQGVAKEMVAMAAAMGGLFDRGPETMRAAMSSAYGSAGQIFEASAQRPVARKIVARER